MFKFFRHAIRGAGYLEGYGHHPGWGMMGIYILVSGLAGAQRGGWNGFIAGACIMLAVILPIFICGCVSRSKDCDEDQARLLKKIKDA